jgi:ADYC domain
MRVMGWGGVFAAAWVWVGCGGEVPVQPEEQLGESASELVTPNGPSLNGSNLNGRNLNGRNLNGRNLNGRNLNGGMLNQTLVSVDYTGARLGEVRHGGKSAWRSGAFDAVWLEGSVFHGWFRGQHLSGKDFTQAHFLGNLGNGGQVELRVEAVTPGTGERRSVWTYRVSYHEPADGRWYPICQDKSGRPVDAIAVAGRWDYRQGVPGLGGAKYDDPSAFTFACEGAAIAKCIRFGYEPWASSGGVSLAAHHQACTRLVRADYCGDGTSHTVDGQWVNLYDALGVQRDTEAWALEAEWDTEGARCFTERNRSSVPVSCPERPMKTRCGAAEAFSNGTLLQSETP